MHRIPLFRTATCLASARRAATARAAVPCRRRFRPGAGRHATDFPRARPRCPANRTLRGCAGTLVRAGQAVQSIEIAAARLEALAGEPDVLECGETEEQVSDLKGPGDTEPGQRKGRLAGDIAAVQLDGAGVGPQRSGDEVEHGALAGAIRAD